MAGGGGARLGVVWLSGCMLQGSEWAVRLGGLGGCLQGCPPWGPVPWTRVLWGSLPLGVCLVLWGGVSWPPWVCRVPSGPVPLPLYRLPSLVSRPYPFPPLVPVPLPVWWSLLWPRSSPGGEGVVVGCAAVFSAAPSVGVASSPRVRVASFPCASLAAGGREPVRLVRRLVRAPAAHLGGRAPPGVARCWPGLGRCWSSLPVCRSWCPPLRPITLCHGPWPFLFLALGWPLSPMLCCPRCPVPVGACLLPWAPPRPLAAGLPFALSLPGVVVSGWRGGLLGGDGPFLGLGGLGGVFGGLGGAEALDRVPEEGFPCRLRQGGLQGGLVRAGGGRGADLLGGVHHVHPFSPSRSPGPLHPAAELPQGRGRPPGEVGGGLGVGGLQARGPRAAVVEAGGGGCVWAARGTGSLVLFVGGGGWGHGTVVVRVAALGGAGASVAGARGGGRVLVAQGTGSARLFLEGGGRGHGTVVARVAASGGAGTPVAGAEGGGRLSAAWGTGNAVLFVGGGGWGHGTVVVRVAALGGAGASVAGARGGGRVLVAQGTGSALLFLEGGGRGHGTVVARVAALGGAGTPVAGAEGGGRLLAAWGTGNAVLFVGGARRGHGTAVACVSALRGAGAAGAGSPEVTAAVRGAGAARVSG